jgi:ABC-type sugar transport system permease subunit
MTKREFAFYLIDFPNSFFKTFWRTLIFTLVFALLEFCEEYFFGSTVEIALKSSVKFSIEVFFPLLGIFFLMILIPRISSQKKYFKSKDNNEVALKKLYSDWLNQG